MLLPITASLQLHSFKPTILQPVACQLHFCTSTSYCPYDFIHLYGYSNGQIFYDIVKYKQSVNRKLQFDFLT